MILKEEEVLYMITTTIAVEGMMCENCEKHVREAVKKNFKVKSVVADRTKNQAVIESKEPLDAEKLAAVITEEGYKPGAVTVA